MFRRLISAENAESKKFPVFFCQGSLGSKPSFRALALVHRHGLLPETIARFCPLGGQFLLASGVMLRLRCHQGNHLGSDDCRGGRAERSPRFGV